MQIFAKGNSVANYNTLPELTCLLLKKFVSPQVGRIMKLTAILLLTACIHVSAKGVSQTVSLSEKNAPLQRVIQAIEAQTEYVFFYNTTWLQQAKKVTIKADNLPLQQALDLCFENQPLTYKISGKTITLVPKEDDTKMPPVIDVRGKVLDSNGQPVSGATVSVKGTSKRAITSADGSFVLSGVNENAVIIISHVQYETASLIVNGNNNVTATLQIKVSNLDEMQVIAYGTTTRRFNTGNVTSIKAEDIQKQPVNNPLLALQGRVPGLFITQNTGVPGGGVTVRIQGQNSIQNGSDPLYVVDGVPYFSQLINTGVVNNILGNSGGIAGGRAIGVGNPLSYLNPYDIESIEVLKDADATAIYGSRAANGAILITTKKGKAGQRKINVNIESGWGEVARKIDMLDRRGYLDMRYEALKNDGIDLSSASGSDYWDLKDWDTTRYTDWQKELIGQRARNTSIHSNISGGTDAVNYFLGASYRKESTVFSSGFNDQRGSVNFNIKSGTAQKKFNFQLNGNYLFDDNQLPTADLTQSAILMEPISPELYGPDGSLNWRQNSGGTSTFANPIATLKNRYRNKTNNLISNLTLGYYLTPDLELKTSFGYSLMQTNEFVSFPLESTRPEDRPNTQRRAQYGYRNGTSYIIEPQINYEKRFWKGRISAILGGTINYNKQDGYSIAGMGYRSDIVMPDIRSAASIRANGSFDNIYKYNALFGRLNYNLLDRYIINLNARRDGSSRFGPQNQFNNFGSIAGAWIFSQEGFFKQFQKIVSFGKLKASYGTTGNDQVGDYAFMNLFNPVSVDVPYQGNIGTAPASHTNPYLEWEETKKLSFGLDLGLLSDKILFTANYSRNRSSNQLLPYPLPVSTGFVRVTNNLPASIENRNWEFTLNTSIIKSRNFQWTSNINLTIPKNKLIDYPNLSTSTYASILQVGEPLNIIKVFPFLGVDPNTGLYIVSDAHGAPTSDPNYSTDRTVIINPNPEYYGGFQNSFSFKGVQLDFLFQFVKQIGGNFSFNNSFLDPGMFYRGFSNQPKTVVDRWRKPGDAASIQMYSSTLFQIATSSDAAYSDASYIRLKNVSLSYNFSGKWVNRLKFNTLRIYGLAQNLLTITNYKGLDPENQTINSLPPLRVVTFGVQFGL